MSICLLSLRCQRLPRRALGVYPHSMLKRSYWDQLPQVSWSWMTVEPFSRAEDQASFFHLLFWTIKLTAFTSVLGLVVLTNSLFKIVLHGLFSQHIVKKAPFLKGVKPSACLIPIFQLSSNCYQSEISIPRESSDTSQPSRRTVASRKIKKASLLSVVYTVSFSQGPPNLCCKIYSVCRIQLFKGREGFHLQTV